MPAQPRKIGSPPREEDGLTRSVTARFLINPAAGVHLGRPQPYGLIEKILLRSSWDFDIKILRRRGDGEREARRAADEGIDLVVGVGGDGTLHDIANGLVGRETALGLLPYGSGNAFAGGIGIPIDPQKAVAALVSGGPVRIDVGEVAGRYFISTSGVGLDAVVGREFEKSPIRGGIPYFGIAFKEILQYQPVGVRIESAEGVQSLRPLLVTVANTNQFGLGAVIAPNAKPDDGLLDVCVIDEVSVLDALIQSPKLFLGGFDQLPNVRHFQTKEVRLVLDRKVPGHVDGEPRDFTLDAIFRVRPGALSVWVPPRADAEAGAAS